MRSFYRHVFTFSIMTLLATNHAEATSPEVGEVFNAIKAYKGRPVTLNIKAVEKSRSLMSLPDARTRLAGDQYQNAAAQYAHAQSPFEHDPVNPTDGWRQRYEARSAKTPIGGRIHVSGISNITISSGGQVIIKRHHGTLEKIYDPTAGTMKLTANKSTTKQSNPFWARGRLGSMKNGFLRDRWLKGQLKQLSKQDPAALNALFTALVSQER